MSLIKTGFEFMGRNKYRGIFEAEIIPFKKPDEPILISGCVGNKHRVWRIKDGVSYFNFGGVNAKC